jgi:hypothetical protein
MSFSMKGRQFPDIQPPKSPVRGTSKQIQTPIWNPDSHREGSYNNFLADIYSAI